MPDQPLTDDDLRVSPCTGDCELDAATKTCTGCDRSLDEVVRWAHMGLDERRTVLERLRAN